MNVVTLKRNIELDESFLCKNFYKHLVDAVEKTFIKSCTKKDGYIVNITEIVDYDNKISNTNSKIVFTIVFKASTLKPQIDDVYNAKVYEICENLDGIQNIFVQIEDLIYALLKTDNVYKIDDVLKVRITNVRFNKKYQCIVVPV